MMCRDFNLRRRSIALAKITASCTATFALVLISACSKTTPTDNPRAPIVLSALTEVTYNTKLATLNITGKLQTDGATDLTVLDFHTNSSCSDASVGQGTSGTFSGSGIQLQVSSLQTSPLYARVDTANGCFAVTSYDPLHLSPPAVFLSSTPASPTRLSSTPALFGTTSAAITQVLFFDDASCSHSVGTGTAANFSTVGVQVTLTPNQTSTIYAETVEPFGNKSACTLLTNFTHNSLAPVGPVFVSVTPISPNNTSITPLIVGTLPGNAVSVAIFSDAACSISLATGTSATFQSTGITVPVTTNSTTLIYAQSIDGNGVSSFCEYLTTYINNTIPPGPPTYLSANPASPTGKTLYPGIKGTTAPGTAIVALFSDSKCTVQIGAGPKSQFEGTGVLSTTQSNTTISIFGQDVDTAGNYSTCVYLTDYTNDTVPPDLPIYTSTSPTSPNNQSVQPWVQGIASAKTITVNLYTDDQCNTLVGTGLGANFSTPGIQATVPPNSITTIYAIAVSAAGNMSACTFMLTYMESVLPADPAVFVKTFPVSPSKNSTTPSIGGSVSPNVVNIALYNDVSCNNPIGSGSQFAFISTGIPVTVLPNHTTTIYAITTNFYSNISACTFLTNYTHDNTPPSNPSYISAAPASPNNSTPAPTPLIKGVASDDALALSLNVPTISVSLYADSSCFSQIGTGTRADFISTGIIANISPNTTTTVYAKAFDLAANASQCTFLTNYIHDDTPPLLPTFISTTPRSPSYVQQTLVKGSSTVDTVNVSIYSDSTCLTPLGTGTKAVFESTGIQVIANQNTTTTLYARVFDWLGNGSTCTFMKNYVHSDLGPSPVTASVNPDGSVGLSWTYDPNATDYIVQRSVWSGGPYTVLTSLAQSPSFTDSGVSNATTYYYVVGASNITGVSKNSTEASVNISVTLPPQLSGLVALPGPEQATLSWNQIAQAATYSLYRGTQPGGPYLPVITGLSAPTYIDTAVSDNTSYYYVVAAENTAGLGPFSPEVSVVPKSTPSTPTGLSAYSTTGGIQLVWSAPPYYNHFNVRRGSTSGTENTIATVNGTSYVDNYVGGTYYYVITATWGTHQSAPSNEVVVVNGGNPIVTATPGNGLVNLSWAANGATNYQILRSTVPGGPYTVLNGAFVGIAYSDSTVTNGTNYYYVLRPNFGGTVFGLQSAEVSATPGATPSAPTSLVVLNNGSNQPTLTWSAPTNFNHFTVWRASTLAGVYSSVGTPATNTYTDAAALSTIGFYKVTASWGSTTTAATNTVSFRNSIPTGFTLTPASTSIGLTWGAVAGASNYNVLRSTSAIGPYSVVSATAHSPFTDSTVVAGTGYYYVVSSNFADGTTGQISAQLNGMAGASGVPSGLTVTGTASSSVTLKWAKVTSATKYQVSKSSVSGGPYTAVGVATNQLNTTVSGLTTGNVYYFVVSSTANTIAPFTYSSNSSEVVAKVTSPATGLAVVPGDGLVNLSWNVVTGVNSYTLERSTDSVTFASVATGLTLLTYTDSTVTNGTNYYYRLLPVFTGYSSFYSAISASVTPGTYPLVPGGPGLLVNTTGTSLTLEWGTSSGATSYHLKQSTTSGGPYTTVASPTSATTVVSGLTAGTTYYFVASALNGVMETTNSPELAVIPLGVMAAPTTTAGSGGTAVAVSWGAVAGAANYDVQRSSDSINFATITSALAATTYSDTTALNAIPYFYRYIPHFAAGGQTISSAYSAAITLGTQPIPPATLAITANGSTWVALDWVTTPNVVSYNVKRSTVSGGPYVSVGTTTTATILTDSGLTPGTIYYYVTTDFNTSGVESNNSNEVSISLVAAPAGLTATAVNKSIGLSWSAVGGAVSYQIGRGTTPGGPYGQIAGALATTSYSDTQIENGVNYYYVAVANFASGVISPYSTEANAVGISTMNLQVPIELTDQKMSSATSAVTFERTRTSLDTTTYDGTVTYFLEAVAKNTSGSSHTITILDSAGTTQGTITVPAATTNPKRFRVSMTPNTGWDSYRVKLSSTASAGDLSVLSARMIVNQVGATMTKIYIPLLSSGAAASSGDATAPVETTAAAVYAELASASIYNRNTTPLATLPDYNAWELETLVAATGGNIGSVSLYDVTQGGAVADTETLFSSPNVTLTNSPFDEGATFFDPSNDGDQYEVTIACVSTTSGVTPGCAPGAINLYKAGLWVTLTHLSKAEVVFRDSIYNPVSISTTFDQERTQIDLSAFSTPTVFLQGVASVSSGSATAELMTAGSSDAGLGGLAFLGTSAMTFSSPNKSWGRSGAVTLNSTDRILTNFNPSGSAAIMVDSSIVVQSVR